jgi:hypothetical protein
MRTLRTTIRILGIFLSVLSVQISSARTVELRNQLPQLSPERSTRFAQLQLSDELPPGDYSPEADLSNETKHFVPILRKLHFSAFFTGGRNQVNDDLGDVYARAGFGGTVGTRPSGSFVEANLHPNSYKTSYGAFQIEYSLSRRVRIGVHYTELAEGRIHGLNGEREQISGEAIGVLVKSVLLPASYPENPFELSVALGLNRTRVRGTGTLGYIPSPDDDVVIHTESSLFLPKK